MAAKIKPGEKFGELIALRPVPGSRNIPARWLCQCSCGNQKSIRSCSLRRGATQSCGCKSVQITRRLMTTHGKSRTAIYGVWSGMHSRCGNPNLKSYRDYGARGITVCKRWESFDNFLADMGMPAKGMTIDRADNNKNYEPGNCRWISRKEQSRNKRNSIVITYGGRTLSLAEWSSILGLSYYTLHSRYKNGCPADRILEPKRRINQFG